MSLLVPTRDEAGNITACVGSPLLQRYPPAELSPSTTASADDTAAIVGHIAGAAGRSRSRLPPGSSPPAGWNRKNRACHQLSAAAQGDRVPFADADPRHNPGCLAAAPALVQRYDADLVWLLRRQQPATIGERLLLPNCR